MQPQTHRPEKHVQTQPSLETHVWGWEGSRAVIRSDSSDNAAGATPGVKAGNAKMLNRHVLV